MVHLRRILHHDKTISGTNVVLLKDMNPRRSENMLNLNNLRLKKKIKLCKCNPEMITCGNVKVNILGFKKLPVSTLADLPAPSFSPSAIN